MTDKWYGNEYLTLIKCSCDRILQQLFSLDIKTNCFGTYV